MDKELRIKHSQKRNNYIPKNQPVPENLTRNILRQKNKKLHNGIKPISSGMQSL